MALVPPLSRPGDIVYIILGMQTPFVLRQKDDHRYELVGECYVHDIMDGEKLDEDAAEMLEIV